MYTVIRAISDLTLGLPIFMRDGEEIYKVHPFDYLVQSMFESLENAKIVLSQEYMEFFTGIKTGAILDISSFDYQSFKNLHKFFPGNVKFEKSGELENAVIKILKLAELLPIAILEKIKESSKINFQNSYLILEKDFVFQYNPHCDVMKLVETDLKLDGIDEVKLVVYQVGHKQHHAIIINNSKLASAPLVRIHSSCYTGDLLASLACDCRDQLRTAVEIMGGSSGIVLYLFQEGRGIGLVNKLRAYNLQSHEKMNTIDANRALGFSDDERDFNIAASMLKAMNISKVRLLTNNMEKLEALEKYGISVIERVGMLIPHRVHNEKYLRTKREFMGHLID